MTIVLKEHSSSLSPQLHMLQNLFCLMTFRWKKNMAVLATLILMFCQNAALWEKSIILVWKWRTRVRATGHDGHVICWCSILHTNKNTNYQHSCSDSMKNPLSGVIQPLAQCAAIARPNEREKRQTFLLLTVFSLTRFCRRFTDANFKFDLGHVMV